MPGSHEHLPQLGPEKARKQNRSLCVESRTGTQTMLQSRALVIALILLLSTTLPEVQSKSIFEKDRRELLAIPEAIASYFYEAFNKVSPKVSQFLLDTVQSPTVIAARYRSFCPLVRAVRAGTARGRSRLRCTEAQRWHGHRPEGS
uniref:Apovitellenin-1 n=1 Tax=Catharus ustulatus TaxID=91951 RepID=A0A8C3TWM8_CATUS